MSIIIAKILVIYRWRSWKRKSPNLSIKIASSKQRKELGATRSKDLSSAQDQLFTRNFNVTILDFRSDFVFLAIFPF